MTAVTSNEWVINPTRADQQCVGIPRTAHHVLLHDLDLMRRSTSRRASGRLNTLSLSD